MSAAPDQSRAEPPLVLVIEHGSSDSVGRFGDWLRDAGLRLEILDSSVPDDLAGYQGLVVMGGAMGAQDDDVAPWLPGVRSLLREAVRTEVPALGVCLGAQLLAVATGGEVVPDPDGPEIGAQLVAKRAAAATDPLLRTLPITPDVLQWHYDTIRRLPPGAVHLASSPMCENEAFRVGRLAWGIQFHIETTPDVVREWAREDAPQLTHLDLDRVVERAIAAHDDIAEAWQPFAAAFADVVRDPDSVPNPHGPTVATAAPVTDAAAIRAALAAEAGAARLPLGMPGVRAADHPAE